MVGDHAYEKKTSFFRRAWERVNEPRFVSVSMFIWYVLAFVAALYSFASPPGTLAGEIGKTAMRTLLVLLALGSGLGVIAVLPGWYWLERIAVASSGLAFILYLAIVLGLHFTTSGNRLFQALMITGVLISAGIRWNRIKGRPYRPIRDKD